MNDSERNASIEYILNKGLVKPKSLAEYLGGLYRQLGFRYLFWDTAQIVALITITLFVVLLILPNTPADMKYSLLFAGSPLVFLLSMICSDASERVSGLYDLKMTCKYSLRQVNVFRIICFSLLGIVFSVGAGSVIGACSKVAVVADEQWAFDLLALSLASLFICAFLFLAIIRHFPGRFAAMVGAVVWLILGVVPMAVLGKRWELLLMSIPTAITIAVAIISAALCGYELTKLLKSNQTEEHSYAIG
jgi:hypothetical protein